MKKTLFITSVTRMEGGYVCVSGLDETGKFIRPEINYPYPDRIGFKREFLFSSSGKEVVRPMTFVEFEFIRPIPRALYHTEDWEIDGSLEPRIVSYPNTFECMRILEKSVDKSLDKALSAKDRSLVTIHPSFTPKIIVKIHEGNRLRCRFTFKDSEGVWASNVGGEFGHPAATDAYWLALCKYLYKKGEPDIDNYLKNLLKQKRIYLIMGVTREWAGKYWRQVSGVLTVPYWLENRTFADFEYDFTDEVK